MKLEECYTIYLIWIIEALGAGNNKINKIVEHFDRIEDIYSADVKELAASADLSVEDIEKLEKKRDLSAAQKILDTCKTNEISICTIFDDDYPERFRTIPNPPVVFFYKGQPIWDKAPLNIGIVGTRRMNKYGAKVAESIAVQLSDFGCTVVSGMAEGIDGVAQKSVVKTGAGTIALLGGGVDVIYPQSNFLLYYDIQNSGCVISEFLPGEKNLPHHFQQRNRLLAGLCDGVVIVQAPKKSGAMITAKWAAEYNRDVFAIPGDIDDPLSEGTNDLIYDGAILTRNVVDILAQYGSLFADVLKEEPKNEIPKEKLIDLRDIKNINASKVIAVLKENDADASTLSTKTEIPIGELILVLTDLQIKGIITERPGGIYALNKGVLI